MTLPCPLSFPQETESSAFADPQEQSLWMWRVAAHFRAHLKLSPIRIYCLTSRLPDWLFRSDTRFHRERNFLKTLQPGLPLSVPRAHTALAHSRRVPGRHPLRRRLGEPPLTLRGPRPSPLPSRPRAPHPHPAPSSPPLSAGVWGCSAARGTSSPATEFSSSPPFPGSRPASGGS